MSDEDDPEERLDEVADLLIAEGLMVDPDYRTPKWAQVYTPKPPKHAFRDDAERDRVAMQGWQG